MKFFGIKPCLILVNGGRNDRENAPFVWILAAPDFLGNGSGILFTSFALLLTGTGAVKS
jgi:hypothetical protein